LKKKLKEKGHSFITKVQGEKWASEVGAVGYVEINSEKFRVEDWNYVLGLGYRHARVYKGTKTEPDKCLIM